MFQLQLCDIRTVPKKKFHFGNAGIPASWSKVLHEKFVATYTVKRIPSIVCNLKIRCHVHNCHYPEWKKPHHYILYVLRSVWICSSHPLLVSQVVFFSFPLVFCPNFCVQFLRPMIAWAPHVPLPHNAVSFSLLLLPLLKPRYFSDRPILKGNSCGSQVAVWNNR